MYSEWYNFKLSNSKVLKNTWKDRSYLKLVVLLQVDHNGTFSFLSSSSLKLYELDVGKYIMAYCRNVQNSCTFSSRLTKSNNRALSKVHSRHSHRQKEGTGFCPSKRKGKGEVVMENFSQFESRR